MLGVTVQARPGTLRPNGDVRKSGQAGFCPWVAPWPLTWPRTGRCAHGCGWGPCRWGTAAGLARTRHRPGVRRAQRRCPRRGPGTPCRSAPPAGAVAAPVRPELLRFKRPAAPSGPGLHCFLRGHRAHPDLRLLSWANGGGPLPQDAGALALPQLRPPSPGSPAPSDWTSLLGVGSSGPVWTGAVGGVEQTRGRQRK